MSRIFLCTKDVQLITGRGRTSSQKIVANIKKVHGKTRYEPITVMEFCTFMGLEPGSLSKL